MVPSAAASPNAAITTNMTWITSRTPTVPSTQIRQLRRPDATAASAAAAHRSAAREALDTGRSDPTVGHSDPKRRRRLGPAIHQKTSQTARTTITPVTTVPQIQLLKRQVARAGSPFHTRRRRRRC